METRLAGVMEEQELRGSEKYEQVAIRSASLKTIENEKAVNIAGSELRREYIRRIMLPVLCILCLLAWAAESLAPELTERDIFGYEAYRVAESGAIFDRDDVIKGWIKDNRVYDAMWNEQHFIRETKADKNPEKKGGE